MCWNDILDILDYINYSIQMKLPGMVAHACNPSSLGGWGGGLPEVRGSQPAWLAWRNPVSTKNTKISWALWHPPEIPATRETDAGESPEPRRRGLVTWDWAIALPLGQQEWKPIWTKKKGKEKEKRKGINNNKSLSSFGGNSINRTNILQSHFSQHYLYSWVHLKTSVRTWAQCRKNQIIIK